MIRIAFVCGAVFFATRLLQEGKSLDSHSVTTLHKKNNNKKREDGVERGGSGAGIHC